MTLKRAFKAVLTFFQNDYEKAILWFSVPNTGLGGITPSDMIMRGRTDRLCEFIQNAIDGNHP